VNPTVDLEQRLADYYESEAPRRAPDWVLVEALATIETTPQQRSIVGVPVTFPEIRLAKLTVAPIAVAIVAVIGATLIGRSFPRPGVSLPTPSVPAPSPGRTPFPMDVPNFRVPFGYRFPLDTGLSFGPRTETFYEIRVPDSGGSGQSAWFLFIQAVEAGLAEPCSPTSDPAPLEGGAEGVLDYLDSIPGVEITAPTPLELDGFPAVSATIELAPSSKACEELWLWASDAEPLPDVFQESGTFGRVMAIDVDGEPILISTWATSRSDEWIPQADALIASVDFQPESNQASDSPAGS
jgi:hypothetical protein